jgi:hypothetical protein
VPPTTSTTQEGTSTTPTSAPGTITSASDTPALIAGPNQSVTIAGHGFVPGQSNLPITFHSAPVALGSAVADASGGYRATVVIPADAAAGAHEIVVSGPAAGGGTLDSVTRVTVVVAGSVAAAPQAPTVAGVAFTGAEFARLLALGAALLLLGVAFVRFGRRPSKG